MNFQVYSVRFLGQVNEKTTGTNQDSTWETQAPVSHKFHRNFALKNHFLLLLPKMYTHKGGNMTFPLILTCMKINHWISNETICTLLYFIIEVPKTQNRLRNSSRKIYFSSLSLSLEMSLPSFGWNVSCISSLIDIKFLKNTNHWTRISSSLKLE